MVRKRCPVCGKYGRDRCVCKTKNKIQKKTSSSCSSSSTSSSESKPPTKCEDEPPAAPVQELALANPARLPKPADFDWMACYYRCKGVWANQMEELKAEHAKDIAKVKEEFAEKKKAWAFKLGEARGQRDVAREGARYGHAEGRGSCLRRVEGAALG